MKLDKWINQSINQLVSQSFKKASNMSKMQKHHSRLSFPKYASFQLIAFGIHFCNFSNWEFTSSFFTKYEFFFTKIKNCLQTSNYLNMKFKCGSVHCFSYQPLVSTTVWHTSLCLHVWLKQQIVPQNVLFLHTYPLH